MEQVVGEIHRLHGTQPEALDARLCQQQSQQAGQPNGAAGFSSPPAQIDTAQHNLAIPFPQPADLTHHLLSRRAPASPAHKWNDAEGTAVVAAVLYLEIGACAVAGGILHGGREKIMLRKDVAHVDVAVVW